VTRGNGGLTLGLALTALAFGRWAPFWSGERALYLLDVLHQAYPWQASVDIALADAAGELPLWNPNSFCGSPLLGDPQYQVLYPPSLVFRVLPFAPAYGVWLAVHAALAATGMGAFLACRGLGRAAAGIGAVGYAFGAHPSLLAFNAQTFAGYAWLPWVAVCALWLGDAWPGTRHGAGLHRPRVSGCRRLLAFVATSLVLGWVVLAGSPQHVLIALVLLCLIAVTETSGRGAMQVIRAGTSAMAAFVIVAALVLPASRYIRYGTTRGMPLSAEAVRLGEFPPRNLTAYIAPLTLWDRQGADSSLPSHWLDIHCVGSLLAALAVYAVFSRWKALVGPIWPVLIGVGIGGGGHLPALGELLRKVPPLCYTRNPAMWLGLTDFGLAWMGAVGLQAMVDRLDRGRSRHASMLSSAIVGLTVAQLAWIGIRLTPSAPSDAVMSPTEEELFLADRARNALMPGRVLHWPPPPEPGTRLTEPVKGSNRADLVRNLRARLMPNLAAAAGCRAADGDNPLVPTGVAALLRRLGSSAWSGPDGCRPMLKALGVRWLICTYPLPGTSRPVFRNRSLVYELPGPLPVAWLEPQEAGKVLHAETSPGRWDVGVLAGKDCVLVIGESAAPGWRLVAPRGEVRMVTAHEAFVSIRVPPGTWRVRAAYDPIEARLGMLLSCLILAAIVGSGRRYRR